MQECKQSLVSALPAYRHVGENLYRRISSGTYYALVKMGCKLFRRSQRGEPISASSFAQELDAMRAVFDYAKDQGLILRNPAEGKSNGTLRPNSAIYTA